MMRVFWKILSKFYCDLIISGINFDPPNILFNKPKYKLDCCFTETILCDVTFNQIERELIKEAILNLESFCNGLIRLDIKFDLDPNDYNRIENSSVLLRVDGYHPSIMASDQKISSTTLGLCEYMTSGYRRLYLVVERLEHHIAFRTTAIHELGHFLGLDHTSKSSIMHKTNFNNVLYPTYIDALELAKIWNVDAECLRYFKL